MKWFRNGVSVVVSIFLLLCYSFEVAVRPCLPAIWLTTDCKNLVSRNHCLGDKYINFWDSFWFWRILQVTCILSEPQFNCCLIPSSEGIAQATISPLERKSPLSEWYTLVICSNLSFNPVELIYIFLLIWLSWISILLLNKLVCHFLEKNPI